MQSKQHIKLNTSFIACVFYFSNSTRKDKISYLQFFYKTITKQTLNFDNLEIMIKYNSIEKKQGGENG